MWDTSNLFKTILSPFKTNLNFLSKTYYWCKYIFQWKSMSCSIKFFIHILFKKCTHEIIYCITTTKLSSKVTKYFFIKINQLNTLSNVSFRHFFKSWKNMK